MALITCRDVSLRYENTVAVGHVSFTVSEGERLYIVGENGSGKSTLLLGLLGLMQPFAGEIAYSEDLRRCSGTFPRQCAR